MNNNLFNDIEEFIRNLDINLAELERTGATFISIGYAFLLMLQMLIYMIY